MHAHGILYTGDSFDLCATNLQCRHCDLLITVPMISLIMTHRAKVFGLQLYMLL